MTLTVPHPPHLSRRVMGTILAAALLALAAVSGVALVNTFGDGTPSPGSRAGQVAVDRTATSTVMADWAAVHHVSLSGLSPASAAFTPVRSGAGTSG